MPVGRADDGLVIDEESPSPTLGLELDTAFRDISQFHSREGFGPPDAIWLYLFRFRPEIDAS